MTKQDKSKATEHVSQDPEGDWLRFKQAVRQIATTPTVKKEQAKRAKKQSN